MHSDEETVTVEFLQPVRFGHSLDNTSHLIIERADGLLGSAMISEVYDLSSVRAPKIPAERAMEIASAEYLMAGMYPMAKAYDPKLMAGRPVETVEFIDRVSARRLNQFRGAKPLTFWRVFFYGHDGGQYLGYWHVLDIDSQTGEIVGQARLSDCGGGEPAPVITWTTIGRVSVVGDRTRSLGMVEDIETSELPTGKQVAVQAGHMVYACRYDAKHNILWRRPHDGNYEPGRPAPSLVKALKANAK
jgi:hypothetical protein